MIPTVQLTKSRLKTSRLALGTSRLHYMRSDERQRLLAAAVDLGFIHFDTAPSYGDGLAEREIGRFIRERRSQLVIATKYGIPPDPIIGALPALAVPMLGLRALARRVGFWKSPRPPITAVGLRESTERSLRRLRTEWIDVLFLHEPSSDRLSSAEAVLAELSSLRQRGLIRHFGLAGAWTGIAGLSAAASEIGEIVQTREGEWPAARPPDITYGAITSSPQTAFGSSPIETSAALERLRSALRNRPEGVVVVSTTKKEHLQSLAEVARQ